MMPRIATIIAIFVEITFQNTQAMNEFQQLIQGSKPVLVDFFATWCGPCKMQAPILEDVKSQVGDKATIIKIDVDRSGELAMSYGIQSVPTLMLFRNGEVLWRASGVQRAADLVALITQFA